MQTTIVGAGPAGCAAGARAAELGERVRIYEEHKVIGEPVACSSVVSRKGLDAAGIEYEAISSNRLKGAFIHLPDGSVLRVKAKQVIANVFDRAKYDRLCAERAEKAGAEIITGTRPELEKIKGAIIGADGVASNVAKVFGFPPMKEFAFCYQEDVESASCEDVESVHVFVSNEILPGFFGWAIPLGKDMVRLGCGVKVGSNPKHALNRLVKKERRVQEMLDGARRVSVLGGVIPIEVRKCTAKGRVLLAGDAAGQTKATTGGGIYFGSMCGKIAGEIAASAGREEELEQYEQTWRKKYERDLKMHMRIRRFADGLSDEEVCRYARMVKDAGAERFLSAYGDMDSPSAMLGKLKENGLFEGILKLSKSTSMFGALFM